MKQLDVLFINPHSATAVYQDLANKYSAIETPTWSLLLAESCRSKGFSVDILDADAERLTDEQSLERVQQLNPRLVCFVVYGQNPNSGTTNMAGVLGLAKQIKSETDIPISIVGSHVSALPLEVLQYNCIDIVLIGEGVYALHNLLESNLSDDLPNVKGIGHKYSGLPTLNESERVVPNDKMDIDLPGYAWDLLPYNEKPLDLYRSHFWHSGFNHDNRTPFAAIYTSLGCQFKCSFCMINIVNRTDYSEGKSAADSNLMRFWSPEFIIKEFDKLADLGVETIRISDEMFFLNKKYFEPLVDLIGSRDYSDTLRMWAYTRVDTVREKYLEQFLKAGIKWLALGIEAANTEIRQEVTKGTFKEVNIRDIVKKVENSGIHVIANYMFGLPDDNHDSMQQTLDLAMELNTATANMYPCQALPGSPLYYTALENGWDLPDSFAGYSFLSKETQPLPTKHLTSKEVLRFRDSAWNQYFTNPEHLVLIEKLFGIEQRENVEAMSKIKLHRNLLES